MVSSTNFKLWKLQLYKLDIVYVTCDISVFNVAILL